MIKILPFVIESSSPLTAFIAGLYAYKRMSLFWRFLFWQVTFYLLITIPLAYLITIYQASEKASKNNGLMYNACIFIETLFLSLAAAAYFKDQKSKLHMLLLFIVYLGVYAKFINIDKPDIFNNYAVVAEGMLSLIAYGMILYRVFRKDDFSWRKCPEVWLCIGLMIYFACNVPYFTVFNYLNKFHPKASEVLFRIVTDVLANVRYFLLALSFWMLRRQAKQNPVTVNG